MELQEVGSRKDTTKRTASDGNAEEPNGSLPTIQKTAARSLNGSAPTPGDTASLSSRMNGSAGRGVTRQQRALSRIQYATLLWTLLLAGWNDGTTGPLLPRIQEVYHVNFTIVSLIFVFACIGFIGGAVANMYLTPWIGFGKTIVLGSICQVVAYSIQAAAPPYPVFVLAYTINGIGIALQDAQANGFVATLKRNPEAKMGILHACYGLGAFLSPLAATHFAQIPRWHFHFLISLGLSVSNTILLIAVFKFKTQDECLRLAGDIIPEKVEGEDGTFKQVMRARAVHLLAFFILIYVGVEVTIGGWIVTFIIDVRGGGPSAGYISSGFFGGLCLGRVLLLWVNKKVGERLVMYIYAFLAIALEFTIWFVPSLIGNAVSVSIIGVLLGPMYPIAMNQANRILPRWILTSSIGWIAGFGQAGSAILPFITGAVAQNHGIKTLQPILIAMMVLMMALWACVPRTHHRTE